MVPQPSVTFVLCTFVLVLSYLLIEPRDPWPVTPAASVNPTTVQYCKHGGALYCSRDPAAPPECSAWHGHVKR